MSPDTYLILLEINEPRVSGRPSVPEIMNRIASTVKALYIDRGNRALVNLRLWSVSEVHGDRRELP